MKPIMFLILLFSLTANGATKYLQADTWKSASGTLTWTPPGVSDTLTGNNATQSLSNKTLVSPTLSGTMSGGVYTGTVSGTGIFNDNVFTLQDNTAPTKKAQFELSGITAGQTRTFTLPDSSTTLIGLSSARAQPTLSIQKITSSTKTPSGTGHYHALTNNSLSLTAGTWELTGIADFTNGGAAPSYTDMAAGYYGANGGDSGSQPATLLSGISGITVDSAYGGSGFLPTYMVFGTAVNNSRLILPTTIVTMTTTQSVYLVTYSAQATSANARISVYFTARKLY